MTPGIFANGRFMDPKALSQSYLLQTIRMIKEDLFNLYKTF